MDIHKYTVGFPGRALIGQPIEKIFNAGANVLLSPLILKPHPCRVSESLPPGPEPPKFFFATILTTSSVMSTGIKIGVFLYTYNVENTICREGVGNHAVVQGTREERGAEGGTVEDCITKT